MTQTATDDLTRIIHGAEKPWIPMPGYPGNYIKVLVADEAEHRVVFMFKMAPNSRFPRHLHHCHAIAFTTQGEWKYEEGNLPLQSMAYEPVGSDHTPMSDGGCEMIVILNSESDRFLENFMDDGTTSELDMAMFKLLADITPEQAAEMDLESARAAAEQ